MCTILLLWDVTNNVSLGNVILKMSHLLYYVEVLQKTYPLIMLLVNKKNVYL